MKKSGFTLIELLVVIAIINILASQMLPALSAAREKGRQANCMSNLKQFSLAIEIYRMDSSYHFPYWLSSLMPSYLGTSPEIMLCLSDRTRGANGHGYLPWGASTDDGWNACDLYAGSDGAPLDKACRMNDPDSPRNSSYLYMFNPDQADDGEVLAAGVPATADSNADGVISWREYSLYMLGESGARGRTPAVRCLWHKNNGVGPVLNIASEDYNVFLSSYSDW